MLTYLIFILPASTITATSIAEKAKNDQDETNEEEEVDEEKEKEILLGKYYRVCFVAMCGLNLEIFPKSSTPASAYSH